MPQRSSEREAAQEAFRGAAGALFISGDTIGAFLASATPGQAAACTAMLGSEIAHRDRAKRARLLRQARFPVPESVEGFDWPDVAFPDGWGRDEMLSLAFVRDVCFVNLSFHKTASVRFTRQREDSSRTSVALAPILSSPTTPRA